VRAECSARLEDFLEVSSGIASLKDQYLSAEMLDARENQAARVG
jgi:hypothetical protein